MLASGQSFSSAAALCLFDYLRLTYLPLRSPPVALPCALGLRQHSTNIHRPVLVSLDARHPSLVSIPVFIPSPGYNIGLEQPALCHQRTRGTNAGSTSKSTRRQPRTEAVKVDSEPADWRERKYRGSIAPKPLKSTLNLPQTSFPMKANLPQNEPARLAAWQQQDLYGQIRAARAGSPKYILHDGPPYANGAIHLGHALNKCIKDFVVKTKTMAGFDAPYVPGWDCHGLPIEIKVDEQLGRKKLEMDPIAVRRACREYAQKYVDLQRSQFERIGVFGRWNNPYLTMSSPTKPASPRPSTTSSKRASSTKASSPSTGASTTAPPSPKPKSSTSSTPAPASTSATNSPATLTQSTQGLSGEHLHHHLDHHPLDDPCLHGRGLQPRHGVRRSPHLHRHVHHRRGAPLHRHRPLQPDERQKPNRARLTGRHRRPLPRHQARRRHLRAPIRAGKWQSAHHPRSHTPPTSPPTRAPEPSTPPPPTA